MEKLRGNQDHDECPRCGLMEDAPHVVRCKGTGTNLTFSLALQKLEITMHKLFTAPEIRIALMARIRQWRKKSKAEIPDQDTQLPRYTTRDPFGVYEAVKEQDIIGWYNLLLGRMSRRWTDAQHKYLESIGKQTSGQR
jgi:hypothetical protein